MTTSGDEFEGWLEQQLQGALQAHAGPSPLAAQAAYHAAAITGGMGVSTFSTITAAVTSKAAAGLATAALVVGGGGAVAATAATGSADPGVWGQTVTQAVNQCKTDLGGYQNIGQCVSAVASQKGQQERALHSASSARENRASEARSEHPPASSGHTQPPGKPTDNPTGKPGDVPTGKPGDVPTGKPTAVPGGPPTGNPGDTHR